MAQCMCQSTYQSQIENEYGDIHLGTIKQNAVCQGRSVHTDQRQDCLTIPWNGCSSRVCT